MANRDDATERFYRLVWPLMATALRTARFLTKDEARAEDLAQETMLKAFRFIDSYREDTDVKSWLLTILRNTWIDTIRGQAKAAKNVSLDALEMEVADGRGPAERLAGERLTAEEILNGFSDQEMIEALGLLPEEIKLTLLLVEVEGLDHEEAAKIMNIPVGTVKSRAYRGRMMLRETLQAKAPQKRGVL